MANRKNLKTPFIKPRKQGGTFYTFGSASEDIGLNINQNNNIVELSHYALLNIPDFTYASGSAYWRIPNKSSYTSGYSNPGDYVFAEGFENYVLNMETILRNTEGYNFSSPHTVSERVFFKWLLKTRESNLVKDNNTGYYYDNNNTNCIVKAIGKISATSHRSDDSGVYNETFVQIPSSYSQSYVYFKKVYDENYRPGNYQSSNTDGKLENVIDADLSAQDSSKLACNGISAFGSYDNETSKAYDASANVPSHFFEILLDLDELKKVYASNNKSISTYDDLCTKAAVLNKTSFTFNAILVYYSVYDSTGKTLLSTNPYGVYILDNATSRVESGIVTYKFPTVTKKQTTNTQTGTSFSFRINIKTSSAYSGDVTVTDDSTASYTAAEDFTGALKNLNTAVTALRSNIQTMAKIANDNKEIKALAVDAINKVNDIQSTVDSIKHNQVEALYTPEKTLGIYDSFDLSAIAGDIINAFEVKYNSNGEIAADLDSTNITGSAKVVADGISKDFNNVTHYDLVKVVSLILAKLKTL